MTDWFYQELKIPGPLPGLNDMVANGPRGRFRYGNLKKRWAETICYLAASQGLKPVKRGKFNYHIIEPNRRRDPSNFCFGAAKFIEDALQAAGYLATDGWDGVSGFTFTWQSVDTVLKPCVIVSMDACEEWKETANERREKGKNKFRRGTANAGASQSLAGKAGTRRQAKSAKVPKRGTHK